MTNRGGKCKEVRKLLSFGNKKVNMKDKKNNGSHRASTLICEETHKNVILFTFTKVILFVMLVAIFPFFSCIASVRLGGEFVLVFMLL